MLANLREKTTGWIAIIIVGLLVVSFAFWGVSSYLGVGEQLLLAVVNDDEITVQEYQQTLAEWRQKLQVFSNRKFTAEENSILKEEVVQRLIASRLLLDFSQQTGMRIAEANMDSTIRLLPRFQDENGQFSITRYASILQNEGLNSQLFKQRFMLDLLSEQLQSTVAESVLVPPQEITMMQLLNQQRRNITYLVLSAEDAQSTLAVSEEEIERYYAEDTQQFISPEQLKIAYIMLDMQHIADEILLDDDKLNDYYKQNEDSYLAEEKRFLSQLVIKLPADASAAEQQLAEDASNALHAQLVAGKSFTEVIETADTLIKGQPFDVDFLEHQAISKGVVEPEVDAFLFASANGDLSAPIRTTNGFSIVQVGEIIGGTVQPLAEVKQRVEQDYRQQAAETIYFDKIDSLITSSYEHPDTLAVSADMLDIEITETDYFSRAGGEGVLAEHKVITASFSDPVKLEKNNSDLIELGNEKALVLRVIEQNPEKKQNLSDIRDEVIAAFKQQKAVAQVRITGESILGQLESGTAIDAIKEIDKSKLVYAENVTRDDLTVKRSVLREAFLLGKPLENTPLYGSFSLGNGDFIVMQITDSADELAQDDVGSMQAIKNNLISTRSALEWQEFTQALQSQAQISIFRNNL